MKRAWRITEIVVSVLGLLWLVRFLIGHSQAIVLVFSQAGTAFFALLGLVLLSWVAIAMQSYIMLRSQGVRLGLLESVLVHAATSLLNYVPMRLGTLLRFRYLKNVHNLGYERTLGLVFLRLTLLILISTVFLMVGIALMGGVEKISAAANTLIAFFVVASICVVLIAKLRPSVGSGAMTKTWNGFVEAVRTGRTRPDRVAAILVLILAQLVFGALRMELAFNLTGTPVALPVLLVVAPAIVLLGLFSFATLGVREALVGGLVLATGHDFATGVLAATLERSALVVLSLSLGPWGVWMMRDGIFCKSLDR